MDKLKINIVLWFLMEMQAEKLNVLGEYEAWEDNEQIQKVIEDIEMFYESELE